MRRLIECVLVAAPTSVLLRVRQHAELSHAEAEPRLRELVEVLGLSAGQLFSILRVAVTGQRVSPPLFESMEVIGKDTVLTRINNAIKLLE